MPFSSLLEIKKNKALEHIHSGDYLNGVRQLFDAWCLGCVSVEFFFTDRHTIAGNHLNDDVLKRLEEEGDSERLFELGLCYLAGIGTPRVDRRAESIFSKIAKQHYSSAQYILGWMYEHGRAGLDLPNQAVRDVKAVEWLEQAARAGFVEAAYKLGCMYLKGRAGLDLPNQAARDVKAVEWLEQAARAGSASGQCILGSMYQSGRTGLDLPNQAARDVKAVEWFEQAARAGSALSQNNLGWMYDNARTGLDLPNQSARDVKAVEWYKQAARAGESAAQNNLGWMYLYGRAGLDLLNQAARDVKAVECFEQAARAGLVESAYKLGCLYQKGHAGLDLPNQAARDVKAVEWFVQAARAGFVPSQHNLGWMYAHGRAGLDLANQAARDVKAVEWYEQAVSAGNATAAWNLGCFYKTRQSIELALKFYSIAGRLYGDTNPKDFQDVIDKIRSFPESPVKDYALESVLACKSKDISAQCTALMHLTKPSQYALFIEPDTESMGMNGLYHHSLYSMLSSFTEQSLYFDTIEKYALMRLLFKIIAARLNKTNAQSVAIPTERQLENIKPYLDMLFKHQLKHYFLLVTDKETEEIIAATMSTLLAYVMTLDPVHHRDFMYLFIQLLTDINESSALWQEQDNVVRMLCTLFTNGQYTMMGVQGRFNHNQLKTLLMHASRSPPQEDALFEKPSIDTFGLNMMEHYGIMLIDAQAVQRQAEDIMRHYCFKAPAGTMPMLERLHSPNAQPLNPLLKCLNDLISTKKNYEVLIHLLTMRDKLLAIPRAQADNLALQLNALLATTGIKTPYKEPLENSDAYDINGESTQQRP